MRRVEFEESHSRLLLNGVCVISVEKVDVYVGTEPCVTVGSRMVCWSCDHE